MFGIIPFLCAYLIVVSKVSSSEEYFENYYDEIDPETDPVSTRNALRWDVQKWPNNVIYYTYIDDYTPEQRRNVDQALDYFNRNTCVRFEQYNHTHPTDGRRRVVFGRKGNRCGTRVGYQAVPSTVHNVYLSPVCLNVPGAIQHEAMHVLGVYHEQSRSDRDQYIDINWDNIDVRNYHNFIRVPVEYAKPYDLPYDYSSIMHYSGYAFAKDPQKPTMTVQRGKENPYSRLGQLDKPSAGDIEKLRRMYRCP